VNLSLHLLLSFSRRPIALAGVAIGLAIGTGCGGERVEDPNCDPDAEEDGGRRGGSGVDTFANGKAKTVSSPDDEHAATFRHGITGWVCSVNAVYYAGFPPDAFEKKGRAYWSFDFVLEVCPETT
jgi:hypothetical protein